VELNSMLVGISALCGSDGSSSCLVHRMRWHARCNG
jgi:hypothetical protein